MIDASLLTQNEVGLARTVSFLLFWHLPFFRYLHMRSLISDMAQGQQGYAP